MTCATRNCDATRKPLIALRARGTPAIGERDLKISMQIRRIIIPTARGRPPSARDLATRVRPLRTVDTAFSRLDRVERGGG